MTQRLPEGNQNMTRIRMLAKLMVATVVTLCVCQDKLWLFFYNYLWGGKH